ncbi:MAG: ATP-binding protein [Pseudomonadota bacterium]|nr:ATP-binding protein [Pseudomonadota bacterium]
MVRIAAPHSLRARLLWFLFGAIVLTATAQVVIAYRTAHAEADVIFDYHMQQMAMALRNGLPSNAVATTESSPADSQVADFVVQVWTANGLQVFRSADTGLPERSVLGFSDVSADGTTYRVFSMQSGSQIIQVAQDMAPRRVMASTLALRTVAPIAVMAPLLMILVWWVVNASMVPVARARLQVAQRRADELTEISEAGLPEEIRPLVHELNLLFARLSLAFDAQKSFVADAAHELRSPLAALKLQVEGLRMAGNDAARELAISRLTAGIDRATRLVEQLLVLARQQASAATGVKTEPVVLADIVRQELIDAAFSAQAHSLDIGLAHADEGSVAGQPGALRILVRNLVDNALKYTPSGGKIDLEVLRAGDHIVLGVDDSGAGIAESDRARVFDRFYRVEGMQAPGSGLGLAIVHAIAEFHGATLTLGHSASLGGLRVTLGFPVAH